MASGRALVNKLKRRNKYMNRNRGFRSQDKIDRKDETLSSSPKAYKLMSEIQRRQDRNFGQQLSPSPEKNPNQMVCIADLTGSASAPAEFASFSGQVAGMTTNVVIEADNAGLAGNSISLEFDGTDDIDTALDSWNTANPSNTASLASGDGSQIPDNAESIDLAGGADAADGSLEMELPASMARESRLKEGDIVKILSQSMIGQELSVLSVDYDADTVELEASSLDGSESEVAVKLQLSGVKKSYK